MMTTFNRRSAMLDEYNTARAAAYKAARVAMLGGQRYIAITWTDEPPFYALAPVDTWQTNDTVVATCYRFDGFTIADWVDNAMYSMNQACCFQYLTADDLDKLLFREEA